MKHKSNTCTWCLKLGYLTSCSLCQSEVDLSIILMGNFVRQECTKCHFHKWIISWFYLFLFLDFFLCVYCLAMFISLFANFKRSALWKIWKHQCIADTLILMVFVRYLYLQIPISNISILLAGGSNSKQSCSTLW